MTTKCLYVYGKFGIATTVYIFQSKPLFVSLGLYGKMSQRYSETWTKARPFLCFEKCKQLLQYQSFLSHREIWWSKFYSILKGGGGLDCGPFDRLLLDHMHTRLHCLKLGLLVCLANWPHSHCSSQSVIWMPAVARARSSHNRRSCVFLCRAPHDTVYCPTQSVGLPLLECGQLACSLKASGQRARSSPTPPFKCYSFFQNQC